MADIDTFFGAWGGKFQDLPGWVSAVDLSFELAEGDVVDELFSVTPENVYDLFTIRPERWEIDAHRDYVLALPSRGFVPYVVRMNGEIAALSTYMDIRPSHLGLEIGHTYILPKFRGSWLNPAMKRAMIGYALEEIGAERVQLKTDGRNLASQNAMKGMGFIFEGVLRRHMVMPDGYIRDTVMFSVLKSDWAAVSEHLLKMETSRGRGDRVT